MTSLPLELPSVLRKSLESFYLVKDVEALAAEFEKAITLLICFVCGARSASQKREMEVFRWGKTERF